MRYVVRDLCSSVRLQVIQLKKFQEENPPPAPPPGAPPVQGPQKGPQKAPAGAQVQDTQGSGGGVIGTGTAPQPGEQGFSGNTG